MANLFRVAPFLQHGLQKILNRNQMLYLIQIPNVSPFYDYRGKNIEIT